MGTTDSDELPETGVPLSAFFGFMIIGEIGYILYKRYQIV
jgi:preprotein translocase subunit Sss1